MYELIKFIDDEWVSTGRRRAFEDTPPVLVAHKGKWVPVVEDPDSYDSGRQTQETQRVVSEDNVRVIRTVKTKTLAQVEKDRRDYITGEFNARKRPVDPKGQKDRLNADVDAIMAGSDTPKKKITAILGISWT